MSAPTTLDGLHAKIMTEAQELLDDIAEDTEALSAELAHIRTDLKEMGLSLTKLQEDLIALVGSNAPLN